MPSSPGLDGGVVEILTTFGSRSAADACAARLVADRLAACVQVDGPIASTYRWRAAVESAEEWRCSCKTTVERCPACVEGILAIHHYETPQVIVVAVEATAAYAAWVRESVSGD